MEPSNAQQQTQQAEGKGLSRPVTTLLCALVLLAAAGLTLLIFSTEPAAVRGGATRESAMLVEVIRGEYGTFTPTIMAMGTVRPARDIVLSPRVSGEITERSPSFTPGGFAEEGELLLRIDPADYDNALRQAESDLRQATADLELEMGRQQVARQDYRLLEESLTGENEALVLRKPQLNAARAKVEAARAAVRQAELALARTEIRALFDAHILSTEVHVGSQVSAGDNLGRLVGVDSYWVEATVPAAILGRLLIPESGEEGGSEVRIRNRTAWADNQYRTGRLFRLIGALEGETRLARVLIAVEDPLARRPESAGRPMLMIGAFVEAGIRLQPITDVVRLPRDYLRKEDTVWVMQDGRLDIREVEVAFRDAAYVYIESGLAADEPVVTTNLSTVAAGADLRLKEGEK